MSISEEKGKEGKGKYVISVEGGKKEGKFAISIKIRNEEIQQSPIPCEILSISTENTFAIINGNEIHAKPTLPIPFPIVTPFQFEIVSVDQSGTRLEKGGALFDPTFEPPFPDAQVSHIFIWFPEMIKQMKVKTKMY